MKSEPKAPTLPLSMDMGELIDSRGWMLTDAETAWVMETVNQAESYRAERPKLRRLLKRSMEEMAQHYGGTFGDGHHAGEAALLQEIRDVLKPRRAKR